MFGKPKMTQREREETILECRVTLRKLQKKYKLMLDRELMQARGLREKGLKSNSNETKIKLNYYMLRVIDQTAERLTDIQDTAQLNEAMSEFANVLASINKMSESVDRRGGKSLAAGIGKMQMQQKKEEKSLGSIFGKMEKTSGEMNKDIFMDDHLTDRLRYGDVERVEKAEKMPEEDLRCTDIDVDMKEINQYLDRLIQDL